MMRFSVLLVFSFVLGLYLMPFLFADRIFYDSFEDEAFTKSAWEKGEGNLHWELSTATILREVEPVSSSSQNRCRFGRTYGM